MFLLRFIGYLFGIGAVAALGIAGAAYFAVKYVSADLPDYTALKNYEPPVMSRVHAGDGELVAEYATERRLFLPSQTIPQMLKNAFLSAEDKNFYEHSGIDPEGIVRAAIVTIQNKLSGRRPQGASTITQQVAKNFLLSNEQTFERKLKEALLAVRIEQAYSKEEILELYMNQIYLGMGAYGVAAASLLYFDKSVHELTISEAAYLAALPKGPNNYHPFRHTDRAIERRNWVIGQMATNGFITQEQADKAKGDPLKVVPRTTGPHIFGADYFAEEVRRQLIERYGERGLYQGGLSVRTSLDPQLQRLARKSLMHGLIGFDTSQGWRGPVNHLAYSGDWGPALAEVKALADVPEWRLGVVLSVSDTEAIVGLQPRRLVTGEISTERERATVPFDQSKWAARWDGGAKRGATGRGMAGVVAAGDVIYVEKVGPGAGDRQIYRLRQVPEISGAIVVMDPHTGRVLATTGGFSFAESEFNRATQAW
ncbi:MAG: transglycosylase domain-containing protein, partial [Hyphomicrobiales bacterium]|nr:transglycosylase domain-containing protein [Hyphomicrobiales bacterium]